MFPLESLEESLESLEESVGNRKFSANQGNSLPEEMTNERDALAHILNNPSIPADGRPRRNFGLLRCKLRYFISLSGNLCAVWVE